MIREDFEKGVGDLSLARLSSGHAIEDDTPEDERVSVQVASASGTVASQLGKLLNRSSKKLIDTPFVPTDKPAAKNAADKAAIDKTMKEFEKFRTQDSVDMPDFLLTEAEGVNDLEKLIEVAGNAKFPDERTWAQVQSRTSTIPKVMEELRPIMEGSATVLSDVQLHGVSRLVATAFDDVESILVKIADNTATPEDMLRLSNAKDTYEVMSGYLKGQGSEVGRALNSLKMTGEALKNRDYAAYERMTSGPNGNKFTQYIRKWADAINNRMEKGDSIAAAMKTTQAVLGSDMLKVSIEFWKNNQLSGPATHVINNASVAAHLLYENIAIRPLAATIGPIRKAIRGGEKPIAPPELLANLVSANAGLRGAMGLWTDNFFKGKQRFNATDKVEDSGAVERVLNKTGLPSYVKTPIEYAVTGSFKVLTATDEAWRGIGFTQEMYALASRQASKENLGGKAHLERMNYLLDNPPEDMRVAAMNHARQMTFTDTETRGWIAGATDGLRTVVGAVPPLQFIIPYINTPSRLFHTAMEMSPLSPLSLRLREDIAAGGVKGDIAMAKMVAGMGMGVGFWQAYEAGIINGSGPDDYKAQEMMRAEGWQPMSIVDGDGKVWGLERMDPFTKSAKFTESLGAFLGYMDKAKYAATKEERDGNFAHGMLTLAQNMMEDQWLEQASTLMDALGSTATMEKWAARTGAGFVPYHALARAFKQYDDPTKPRLTQDKIQSSFMRMMEDQVAGNYPDDWPLPFPGVEADHWVRSRRKWDGDVYRPEQSQFAASSSPFGNTTLKSGDWATRLMLENGVYPEEPSSAFSLPGAPKTFSLSLLDPSERMYDVYIQIVGEERKSAMEQGKSVLLDLEDTLEGNELVKAYGPGSVATRVINGLMDKGMLAGKDRFLGELVDLVNSGRIKIPPGRKGDQLLEFVNDAIAVVEDASRRPDDHWLEGPVDMNPARGPYNTGLAPIPEMK